MNYLTQTAGLPKFSALASVTGALFILISILALGHRYGAVGAAYATAVGYMTMATVAMILVVVLKLDIVWSCWRPNWQEITLAAAALICSAVALAAPVGSVLGQTITAICVLLILSAIISAARRRQASRSNRRDIYRTFDQQSCGDR
jgi:O-antigen/teichoic acid export membrane protein